MTQTLPPSPERGELRFRKREVVDVAGLLDHRRLRERDDATW
jgi:hypothetical protein